MRYFFPWLFLAISFGAAAQEAVLSGMVVDENNAPVEGASVFAEAVNAGSATDSGGLFTLTLPSGIDLEIVFTHINYQSHTLVVHLAGGEKREERIVLKEKTTTLQQVEIRGENEGLRSRISAAKISPRSVQALPTPFGEFNKILGTLPGVVSHSEFSSTYMVRGGNFDENLVYVNDIPIYRPFLVRAGQQEGLSFVNADMIDHVEFSSGGWQARHGDKLSSNLNIYYKQPEAWKAAVSAGLLGGSGYLEGKSKNEAAGFLLGARHKRSTYLLNTLETEGEYLPNFTDIQALINFDLNHRSARKTADTQLDILLSYAHNDYLVIPKRRETAFGNLFDGALRLAVAFDGKELLKYNIYQGGLKLTRRFSDRWTNKLIVSGFHTREREYFDLEGGYRICDVDKDLSSEDFNECLRLLGVGSNFRHGRNKLEASVINVEDQLSFALNGDNQIEIGAGYSLNVFDDYLEEYRFRDSADYATVEERINAANELTYNQFAGYIQNTQQVGARHTLNYGVRLHYMDYNGQWLVSPRMQYAYRPPWKSDVVIKASAGLYRQPPFYREFRRRTGGLNEHIRAQSALHIIAGVDYNLKIWNRPFKFTGETYFKRLKDVIPYDIENVRIRYFADNSAKAYAAGADLRLSGEFVPGTESWFSLSILTTKEDLENDERGYVRRPTDQAVTANIFFEDHLPNDPTMRMNLNLAFGSGLPFGPPGDIDKRSIYSSEFYQRVDIGFSKLISLRKEEAARKTFLNSLWLGVEILNLLGNENPISYTWVKDFNNIQYGVPNTLSARFLNAKITIN